MSTAKSDSIIIVYAHWAGLKEPVEMGILRSSYLKGKDLFSFEYDPEWLKSERLFLLDPDLM